MSVNARIHRALSDKATTLPAFVVKALTALSFFAFAVASANAQTFDATSDFSVTNGNPNGVWQYGYTLGLTGTFIPYDTTETFGSATTFEGWAKTGFITASVPTVAKNVGAGNQFGVPPGSLNVHPGDLNSHSIIRFTAPSSGNYILASQLFRGDFADTDATVYLNGNATTPLFSAATTNTNPAFNTTLSLNQNDVLSFSIGPAADGFFNDSTPVNIVLTQGGTAAAPEPGTLGLLGIALPLAGVVMGRKGRAPAKA